jgi:predicted membrane metal-binding protein
MKVVLWIIVVIVFLAAGLFALFNHGIQTDVQIFKQTIEGVSVALVGLICFGFGVFSILLFSLAEEIRLRSRARRLQREIDSMRKEVNALRNLPLAPEILARKVEDAEEEI